MTSKDFTREDYEVHSIDSMSRIPNLWFAMRNCFNFFLSNQKQRLRIKTRYQKVFPLTLKSLKIYSHSYLRDMPEVMPTVLLLLYPSLIDPVEKRSWKQNVISSDFNSPTKGAETLGRYKY